MFASMLYTAFSIPVVPTAGKIVVKTQMCEKLLQKEVENRIV